MHELHGTFFIIKIAKTDQRKLNKVFWKSMYTAIKDKKNFEKKWNTLLREVVHPFNIKVANE